MRLLHEANRKNSVVTPDSSACAVVPNHLGVSDSPSASRVGSSSSVRAASLAPLTFVRMCPRCQELKELF